MDRQLHLLTGAYALNALEPAERDEFETEALASEATLREVRSLSETAALLAEHTAPVAPPPRVKANIMAAIRQTPQLSAAEPSGPAQAGGEDAADTADEAEPDADIVDLGGARTRRRDRAGRMPRSTKYLAAAAAAFLLSTGGLTGIVISQNNQQDELRQQLDALASSQDKMHRIFSASDMKSATQTMDDGAVVTLAYSASAGLAALTASGLPSLPADKGYELWLIGDDGATPMGMLDANGTTPRTTLLEGSMDQATYLGITIEPAQGSEQPTTEPIMLQQL